MCSIAMPAELMLGHSPPVYGHHLLYNPLMMTGASTPGRSLTNATIITTDTATTTQIRPCISTASITFSRLTEKNITKNFNNINSNINNNNVNVNNNSLNKNINNRNDTANENKQKKRVVFADDRGRPLTQIRVMSEPSNMPPSWTNAYLIGLTRGLQAEAVSSPWECLFQQPASDYLAFRRKLDQKCVCLENVIIKESEQCLIGTIKVKNLAYNKEVIVRVSNDNWKTHEDVYCTFVEQLGCGIQPSLNLYDTFKFKLTLPVKTDKIEFCVCYRVSDQQYWDNNDKKNYIVKKRQEHRSHQSEITIPNSNNGLNSHVEFNRPIEATRANLKTWSEFASWQHLNNDAPYW